MYLVTHTLPGPDPAFVWHTVQCIMG